MSDFSSYFVTNWLYLTVLLFLKFLASDITWFIVLIVIFIVLVNVKSAIEKRNLTEKKIKSRILPKAINFFTFIIVLLLLFVGYVRFSPAIIDFFKVDTTPSPTTPTTQPTTPTTPGTKTVPTQPSTPTYQAPKQMYYAISCYGCWVEGCPRDGYSYSGYDSYYYTYYTALCKACNCNSLNGRSFWK